MIALVAITVATRALAQQEPSNQDPLARACNYHAEQNMRHFALLLRTFHPDSPVTAADMQKEVVKLCVKGVDEHDAYKTVANLLGAHVP
jgi:hypothetical protein